MAKNQKNQDAENTSSENTPNENAGSYNPAEEHAKNKSEKAPLKKKVIVSGAEFWKFAPQKEGEDFNGAEFVGKYCGEVKREQDGKDADTDPSQKAGAVIGYDFEQHETGDHYLISNSHAIEKALEKTGYNTDLIFCIEFLGKGLTANKKPYNRFEVSVLE